MLVLGAVVGAAGGSAVLVLPAGAAPLVVSAANSTVVASQSSAPADGAPVTITIPDPAWVVIELLQMAAQIARDTLVWQQAIMNDCNASNQAAEIGVVYDNVNSTIGLVDSRTTAIDNEEQLLYALVQERTTLILNKISVLQASMNLELKVTIEEDLLQGSAGAIADLELPSSAGGYLDALPIGVQQVVTNALAAVERSGVPFNPAAPRDLAAADAALAAREYKVAFGLFGQTYREIVQ